MTLQDQAWYRSRGMQGIESLLNAGYIRSSSSDSVPSSLSSGRKYVDNNEQPMPWFHGNISREHTERYFHSLICVPPHSTLRHDTSVALCHLLI